MVWRSTSSPLEMGLRAIIVAWPSLSCSHVERGEIKFKGDKLATWNIEKQWYYMKFELAKG